MLADPDAVIFYLSYPLLCRNHAGPTDSDLNDIVACLCTVPPLP
jgi:hypothetical protein